jgi:hypothetical protein
MAEIAGGAQKKVHGAIGIIRSVREPGPCRRRGRRMPAETPALLFTRSAQEIEIGYYDLAGVLDVLIADCAEEPGARRIRDRR